MESLSLSINKEKEIPLNLFVVLLFLLLNPLYAISICAVLNLMNSRINFRLFSIMFALSFALYFFLRDWKVDLGASGDAVIYLQSYQMAGSRSLSDIFYQFVQHPSGQEPFWNIYLWLFRKLFGYHVGLFAFSNFFIIFLLTAYLGKLVDEKRFVIVIFCIIFVSPGFLYNVFGVWRHTFALLLFFIGIFLFETSKNRLLSRSLMYSSALFHLVTLPLVILYEFFTLCAIRNKRFQTNNRSQRIKWYSIEIITYVIFVALVFKLSDKYGVSMAPYFNLSSLFASYSRSIDSAQSGYDFLFNPLSYVVIFYFWFNQKQITKNDVFIGINYFASILVLMTLGLPTQLIGRILYVFLVGAAILSAKLIVTNFRLGFICLLTIICYRFYIFSRPEGARALVTLLDGEFLNPVYGLVGMILNYGTFLVLPYGV